MGMKKVQSTVYRGGCMHCPQSHDVLAMDTVLYNGFGGYRVLLDGGLHYQGDPNGEWDSFLTLRAIENRARKMEGKWEVVLDNPLRGATWFRIGNDHWILTETNQGFA